MTNVIYSSKLFNSLSNEERIYLFTLVNEGSREAVDRLVLDNMRLVIHISKKFMSSGIEMDDLISIGTPGLIKAVNTYDITRKIKFSSYAGRCITNEILMYLRKKKKHNNNLSIDAPIFTTPETTLSFYDILFSEENLENHFDNLIHKQGIMEAIMLFDSLEKKVIKMRYWDCLSQKEIAEKTNFSQSYISRIEKRALKKIKEYLVEKEYILARSQEFVLFNTIELDSETSLVSKNNEHTKKLYIE